MEIFLQVWGWGHIVLVTWGVLTGTILFIKPPITGVSIFPRLVSVVREEVPVLFWTAALMNAGFGTFIVFFTNQNF